MIEPAPSLAPTVMQRLEWFIEAMKRLDWLKAICEQPVLRDWE